MARVARHHGCADQYPGHLPAHRHSHSDRVVAGHLAEPQRVQTELLRLAPELYRPVDDIRRFRRRERSTRTPQASC